MKKQHPTALSPAFASLLADRKEFKGRSAQALSILIIFACSVFVLVFSPLTGLGDFPLPYMVALLAGIGGLALSRRGYDEWVLLATGTTAMLLIATVHVTTQSGDTAPFYALPVVFFLLFTMETATFVGLVLIALITLGGARWLRPFPEVDPASHTTDMVFVLLLGVIVGTFVRLRRLHEGQLLLAAVEEADRSRETAENLRLLAEKSALEAQDANLAKSRFLAAMSHELRTPLNAIIGYAGLLQENDVSAEDLEDLVRIERAGTHLLELIDDVLDLSQVEAGKTAIDVREFNVHALFHELGGWLEPKVRANQSELILQVTRGVVLRSDPRLVRQILINLASNASRFTKAGQITLSARAERNGLEFIVQDTGIGIAEEHLARIFEPFLQADESTHRNFGGTGLGLSLVLRFVVLLSGTIRVESKPGKGSTFIVWLPSLEQGSSVSAANTDRTDHGE